MKNMLLAAAAMTLVLGASQARAEAIDLVGPISDYKLYVVEKVQKLVTDTTAFTDAVKAGDVDKAKSLFASTRMSYEAIEPVAELFADLDASIDSRADDYELKEQDPKFPGFHRIEYGLWVGNSADGLAPIADKLLADVKELDKRLGELTFPPDAVVGGAAVLMEEVAATKISGEEDRYSHTDIADFRGNFDGSRKIFDLIRPKIEAAEADFVSKVTANFDKVDGILNKYVEGDGFMSYDKLTDEDRKILAAAVNTLAEDLSTLRGKVGLN